MTSSLSSDAARGWTTRVPHGFIGIGLPLTFLAMILFIPSDDTYLTSIDDVVSWKHLASWALSLVGALAAALAWAVPRVCLAAFVTTCLFAAAFGGDANEVVAGIAWTPVAAVDLVLMLRQSAIASDWPREHATIADRSSIESATGYRRWAALALAVVALAGSALALGWWVTGRADLIEFDERAIPATAVITKSDPEYDTVTARVQGRTDDYWVNDATAYQVGESLPVRIDPEGEFRPMGPDDADPRSIADLGAVFAPLLFLSLLLIFTPRHRDHQTLRAAEDTRPVRALVRPSQSDEYSVEILTTDGRIIGMASDVTYSGEHDEEEWAEDDPLLILGEGPNSLHVDLSALPPGTDLDAWLSENEQDQSPASSGPDDGPQPALIFGLERYGRHVVIQLIGKPGSAPETLIPGRPIRDPFTLRALFGRLTGRRRTDTILPATETPNSPEAVADEARQSEPSMLHSLLVASKTFGPLVGLVAVFLVVGWLNESDDPSFVDVGWGAVQGAFAGFAFAEWFSLERPLARLGRFGMLLPGSATDRLLPDHRLVSIDVGQRSATITLRDPDERVGIIVDPDSEHSANELAELKRVFELVQQRQQPEPSGWTLPRLLPAPGMAIIVISAIVGAAAILLG